MTTPSDGMPIAPPRHLSEPKSALSYTPWPSASTGQSELSAARQTVTRLPERNLDVLRAVAVLLVLGDHTAGAAGVHAGAWNWIWAVGRVGVLLFFVHTSLVLMSSLERGGSAPGWVRRFYIRRGFRIYPLAILLVLVAATLRLPTHVTADGSDMARAFPTPATLLSNVLLVQNVTGVPNVQGVLWSLPLEVQMYILLPICYVVARRRSRDMAILVVFMFLMGAALTGPLVNFVPGLWHLSVFTFGPCFISGVTAYHLLRRPDKRRLPGWTWPIVLGGIALLFAAMLPTAQRPDLGWWPCLGLGLTIPLVDEMRVSWLTTASKQVAKYSYGIYLAHVPLLWFWIRAIPDLPVAIRWIGFALTCALVPVMLYRWVEEPLIKFGGRIARSHPSADARSVTL